MKEIFRDVLDYEGLYQVSNYGNVKSLNFRRSGKEKELKPSKDGDGYLHVRLSKNGLAKTIKVHKLVAIAFLNHIPDGYKIVVDHINSNKLNNNLNNLQLISQRENTSKDKKNCSSKYTGVTWYKPSNKWQAKIHINRKLKHLGYFHNELDASNKYQETLKTI